MNEYTCENLLLQQLYDDPFPDADDIGAWEEVSTYFAFPFPIVAGGGQDGKGVQGDHEGTPLQWNNGTSQAYSSIVGAHTCGRPGYGCLEWDLLEFIVLVYNSI
jgi:hypothetical protein